MTHRKEEQIPDPAEDYNEWIRNRYNPGYYLGGRISPLMRASQSLFSATEKRIGAVLAVVFLIILLVGCLWRLLRESAG
jgi:hypothetical protein